MTALLAALLLLPLAGSAAVLALRRREPLLGPVAAVVMVATFGVGIVAAWAEPEVSRPWGAGLELRLAMTGLARVVGPLVPFIAAPILLYAAAHEETGVPRLLAWMSAFVGAMELLVLAADLLTLLVGFELVALCSWTLIAHEWRDPANGRDAARAFLTVRFGDLGLYFAAGLTFAATGSFAFEAVAGAPRPLLDAIAAGILLAAAAKSAQLPFSPWLFSAMAGPTAVSALLHSATMVAAGGYALARLAPSLAAIGWFAPAVAGLGLATALAGGTVAALHPEVKKALAASTSAQYGLMLVAIGAGSAAAAAAHLVAHAAFKALLFLGAGIAIRAAGTAELDGMGLGARLPRTAWLFAIGALALAAVPPMGAAWTKEEIVKAAGQYAPWFALATIVAGSLSALYAARLHLLAFGPGRASGSSWPARRSESQSPEDPGLVWRPSPAEITGAGVLAAATLALSTLWLPGGRRVVEAATRAPLVEGGTGEALLSLAAVTAGLVAGWALWGRNRLASLGLPVPVRLAAEGWLGFSAATDALVARPTRILASNLAAFDDRVIDAGVRAAAWVGRHIGQLFSRWTELFFDGILVFGTARGTILAAAGSRFTDDSGIDKALEATAASVGRAGGRARRVQTGLAHHYMAILFAGLLAIVALAALGR